MTIAILDGNIGVDELVAHDLRSSDAMIAVVRPPRSWVLAAWQRQDGRERRSRATLPDVRFCLPVAIGGGIVVYR